MKIVHINSSLGYEEKHWPQILAILTASILCLVSGILFAWPTSFLPQILDETANSTINEDDTYYLIGVKVVGVIIFTPIVIFISKYFGRKPIMLVASIPFIISFAILTVYTELWQFYLSKFFCGCGDAIILIVFPIYLGEIATPKIRGIWGTFLVSSYWLGCFIINVVGRYLNVQQTAVIGIGIIGVFLLTFSFMPESPYFLMTINHDTNAKDAFKKLRRLHNVEDIFLYTKSVLQNQLEESRNWAHLISVKANKNALIAATFLRLGQGFPVIFPFYFNLICEKSDWDVNVSVVTEIYTAALVFFTVCLCYYANKLGRRKSYLFSIFFSSVVLLLEACYFIIETFFPEINLSSVKWFPIAGIFLYAVVSSFGVNLVPNLVISEIFSSGIKIQAVGLVTVVFACNVIVTNFIFYYINFYIGLWACILFFGICHVFSVIVGYYVLPETKNMNIEEIQTFLKNY